MGFKTPYEMFRELSDTDAEKLAGLALITRIHISIQCIEM